MKELSKDLWSVKADFLCITTNGTTRADAAGMYRAIMGAGCALEAKLRYPGIDVDLGDLIETSGNHVHQINDDGKQVIFSFPVKHHWSEMADLKLIDQSCQEIDQTLERLGYHHTIVIPRPGCGRGNRDWERQVRPILRRWFAFNPNVFIVHKQDTIEANNRTKYIET